MANVSLVQALSKALTLRTKAPTNLVSPDSRGGWMPLIREGFAGAWQANITTEITDILSHPTVYACIKHLSEDVAKMRLELVQGQPNDVWVKTENPAFTPVLRKPNGFQTMPQFIQSWMISVEAYGNAYIFLQRDGRQVVTAMYVLDPARVRPLIAPDGSVFYALQRDDLSTQPENGIVVPAREIIHDRINPLFHPLVGISPLYASGIAAYLGNKILTNSAHFFGNDSRPPGIITVPGAISQQQADDLLTKWQTGHSGANKGVPGILTGGMTFTPISQTAEQAQLTDQSTAVAQAIAITFGVPFFMVGGPLPPYNNIQAQTVQYFIQGIQPRSTAIETLLDQGLGLTERINGVQYGTQFNRNDLLLMDSQTMMQVIRDGVGAGVLKPNEGRAWLDFEPVEGGDTPYLQNQQWSLADLNRRSEQGAAPPAAPQLPTADMPPPDMPPAAARAALRIELRKQLAIGHA